MIPTHIAPKKILTIEKLREAVKRMEERNIPYTGKYIYATEETVDYGIRHGVIGPGAPLISEEEHEKLLKDGCVFAGNAHVPHPVFEGREIVFSVYYVPGGGLLDQTSEDK